MKPDYQIKQVKLFNIDCMDFMKEIPDNYYELAIVDPPYGIGFDGQKECDKTNRIGYEFKKWDSAIPDKSYFRELMRVSKSQIIWGGNYMTDHLFQSRCWIIWDKMQKFSGSDFEMAWTNFNRPSKAFRLSRVEAYTHQTKIHPTQKPRRLYKWILENYAKEGFKIFDSHGGSFSSACACLDMGFEFDGCEIDKEYFDNAVERLKNNVQDYLDF